MRRITPEMDDLRQKINNLRAQATVARTFGDMARYERYTDDWRRVDAQLYALELEQRDAERQAA